uniref:Uncharacterized protein n=1 Tax=Magallana gigas TaxID=29159 RepID=A0A8W8LUQ0_MAGGI
MKTADHLSSSLPAVLKQYVPEYEPTVPVKAQDSLSPRNTSSQKSSRSSRSPGRKASSARNSSRNEDNLLLGSESSDNGQNKRRQSSEAEVKGLNRVIAPDHL